MLVAVADLHSNAMCYRFRLLHGVEQVYGQVQDSSWLKVDQMKISYHLPSFSQRLTLDPYGT